MNKTELIQRFQALISDFNTVNKEENSLAPDAKATIFASFGYIIGDILLSEDDTKNQNFSTIGINNIFIDSVVGENNLSSVNFITLTNAYIFPFASPNPIKIDAINIFVDQITGFSFGSSDNSNLFKRS